MSELAALPAQSFLESMHAIAMDEGGDLYREGLRDGFCIRRTYEGSNGTGDAYYEFAVSRYRDEDTKLVSDTMYVFEEGTVELLEALPPEVYNATDIDPETLDDESPTLTRCTTVLLSTSHCSVEYNHGAVFCLDNQELLAIPTVDGEPYYGDPEALEPQSTQTESGLTVIKYRLPVIQGIQEAENLDPFAQLAQEFESSEDKAQVAISGMAHVLEMLRISPKP